MLFDMVKDIASKYEELQTRILIPEVYGNPQRYTEAVREINSIRPLAEAYNEYCLTLKQISEAEAFLEDQEMKAFAQEEINAAQQKLKSIEQLMKELLIPADKDDTKNAVVEIRCGVGGEESALFAADLFRMYSMYAENKCWKIEITQSNITELGGIKEIVFILSGNNVFSKMKYEAGTHRVQRVPVTESGGRIHTSAATVSVLPEADDIEVVINPNDIRIDTYRSSGAGGQHVNKTESAIRITHIPTGLVVECQDERSQYKNKDRAFKILRSRLYELESKASHSKNAAEKKSQVGSGDRSERIRTYNFPQSRVTDHRLNGEIRSFAIDSVINGSLDQIIDELIKQDNAEKMNGMV